MAVGGYPVLDLPMTHSAALTRFRFVDLSTTVEQEVDAVGGADSAAFGVIQETTTAQDATDDRAVAVRVQGVSVVEAGGAISLGAAVYNDASGKATATGTTNVLGTALSASAADGDWIKVLLA